MKEKKMTVSLVISTYNWVNALELVLLSVTNQTVLPNEVIIADDGSREETKQMIDEMRKTFPIPLIHVWHVDEGFRRCTIMNKAIAKASSDYILQVDGDVLLNKHFVEDHIYIAQPQCFVCGSRVHLNKNVTENIFAKRIYKITWLTQKESLSLNSLRIKSLIKFLSTRYAKDIMHMRGCNMAFWRNDFIKVNGYNESLLGWGHEDSELAYRLHNIGVRKLFLKFGGLVYHLNHKIADKNNEHVHNAALEVVRSGKVCRCEIGIQQYL